MGLDCQSAVAGEFGDLLAHCPARGTGAVVAGMAGRWLAARSIWPGPAMPSSSCSIRRRAGSDLERMIADRTAALDQQLNATIADFNSDATAGTATWRLSGGRRQRCGVSATIAAQRCLSPPAGGSPDFDAQAGAALLALAEQASGPAQPYCGCWPATRQPVSAPNSRRTMAHCSARQRRSASCWRAWN